MQLKDYMDLIDFLQMIRGEKSLLKNSEEKLSEEERAKFSMQEHEAGRLIRLLREGEVILK